MSLPRDPDALFARARAELSPSPADEQRVLAALAAKIGPPSGGGPGGGAGGGAGGAPLAKIGLAVVVAGALAFGIVHLVAPPPPPAPPAPLGASTIATAPPPPSSAMAQTPSATAPVMNVGDLPSANAPPRGNAPVAPATAKPSPDMLAAELRLVERMHAAERRGDLATVLALTAEHEREFPNGALVEEREAVRAVTECKTDASARGRALARFLDRFPRSSHEGRVSAACGSGKLDP